MTREEIERSFQYNMTNEFIKWDKAVNAEYKEENEEAFYQGAYAAQKYLIEKACEWLVMNASDYIISTTEDTDDCVVSLDMVEDFRKAMEE